MNLTPRNTGNDTTIGVNIQPFTTMLLDGYEDFLTHQLLQNTDSGCGERTLDSGLEKVMLSLTRGL